MGYSKLLELLGKHSSQPGNFWWYEVEHDFPGIGQTHDDFLNARRIPDPPANLKVILLAIEDITRRKQIEECDISLAAIVTPLLRALSGKTPGGDVISWNKGAETIYGYTENEIARQKTFSLLALPVTKRKYSTQLKKRKPVS